MGINQGSTIPNHKERHGRSRCCINTVIECFYCRRHTHHLLVRASTLSVFVTVTYYVNYLSFLLFLFICLLACCDVTLHCMFCAAFVNLSINKLCLYVRKHGTDVADLNVMVIYVKDSHYASALRCCSVIFVLVYFFVLVLPVIF